MTIIADPARTSTQHAANRVGRVFKTLAAAETEGLSLRTGLLAALIADFHDVDTAAAIDLAMYDAFDDRVKQAGMARDLLIAAARAADSEQSGGGCAMTAFADLTRGDLIRPHGSLGLVLDQPKTPDQFGWSKVTVQPVDRDRLPCGPAVCWPCRCDADVPVVRHNGVWSSECAGLTADVMAEHDHAGGAR
ncbi:hypothetical protein N5079_19555 [Planotetraspora sp. A-T 1434]|uniref:hypothetical protein n=1 Tax=Planotetraspora sp. A-T 1434 TaxID=2979219 RepID=UPI0021C16479|nr:hypothetical protein [Planotetraspora sp. A-T 1434]MCT9932400.1 hypothetical protein [Planotetraspora sp. A-T 1434]